MRRLLAVYEFVRRQWGDLSYSSVDRQADAGDETSFVAGDE
jgi:hypothetical protein